MSLLPSSPDIVPDTNPRVVGVDSEDADALMSALSSSTARRILAELHENPAPPAALADRVGTSLQNTQYHLSNLDEAGAVEVVGTAYSEKGREMDVFAPADQPLVIFAGRDEQVSGIRAALRRLVGAVGALLVGSLAIQQVFGRGIGELLPSGTTGGGDSGAPPAADTPTPESGSGGGGATATPTPEATPVGADDGAAGATPTPDGPSAFDAGDQATRTATEAATATPAPQASAADTGATTPTTEVTETATAAAQHGADAVTALPPGVLFFLGGMTVLAVAIAIESRR